MKTIYLRGSLAAALLCLFSLLLSAQTSADVSAVAAPQTVEKSEASFTYSAVAISSPAFYEGEEFQISLSVENTGNKEGAHDVQLYLQDKSLPTSRKKQATQKVSLGPGLSKSITFTLTAEDLIKAGDKTPSSFVFFVGKYEIGVDYIKK